MNVFSSSLQPAPGLGHVRISPVPKESPTDSAASLESFSVSNLSEALEKEKQYQQSLQQQQLAKLESERQQIAVELAQAARVQEQTLSLAEHNSVALDQLNDSKPVKQLAQFLENYDKRLNERPPGDHHFYHSAVRLSAEHMTIARDGFEELREGWLTLDSGGIHLIQLQDRVMGEDCYVDDSSSSVRPWLPVRLYDKWMGHHNREILARVDLSKVEERIAQAIQDAQLLAGNPSPAKPKAITTLTTQRWNNTFDQI